MTEEELRQLLERYCDSPNDEQLQRELFRALQSYIKGAVFHAGGSMQTYEDVRVDVSYEVMEATGRLQMREPAAHKRYLWKIARSWTIKHEAGERRHNGGGSAAAPDTAGGDPLSSMLATEQLDLLQNSLSQSDWELVEGRLVLGLSYPQLAEKHGATEDAIRQRFHRARARAREILDNSLETEKSE